MKPGRLDAIARVQEKKRTSYEICWDEPTSISWVTSSCLSCFALRIILTRDCKTVVKLLAMAFNQCSGGDRSITRRPWLVLTPCCHSKVSAIVCWLQIDGYTDMDATSPKVCYVDVQSGLLLGTIDCFCNRKRSKRAPFYILSVLKESHETHLRWRESPYQPHTWPRQSSAEQALCLSVVESGWCAHPCHLLQATEEARH